MNRATEDNLTRAPECVADREGGRQSPPEETRPDLPRSSEAGARAGASDAVIPVVAEELRVGRQSVETGRVRLTKLVRERQEVVDEPSRSEEVVIERVPVNRRVDIAPAPRQEGDTMVFPVVEEVVVLERRLMLKEEVRVTKRVLETRDPQTVTLRSEDVKIEQIPADGGVGGT